jgi:endo-1,4-beta-xylanase
MTFARPLSFVGWLSLAVFALATSAQSPTTTLRSVADRTDILVGTAVRPSLLSEPAYSATLAREFNMVEPEDVMKWWVVRRDEGFDFRQGDELVKFAQAHNMKVRGHCLVWDHDNPQWLTEGHFTPSQLSHLLQEHITTVMKHYAGQVFAWDVVNEALNEKGEAKDSLWYNQPGIGGLSGKGTAYVEQALRWAHEADPKALLFYNEAEGEGMNGKSDAVYAMVKDFKQHGVPIDGVGLQLHISRLDYDTGALAANIARLTAMGLQVHITELDVSLVLGPDGQPTEDDLRRQADVYRGVAHTCLQNPGCTAIQTWGFTDKYSWIGSHSHGTRGAALPFDRGYKPKPAHDAILRELRSTSRRTN